MHWINLETNTGILAMYAEEPQNILFIYFLPDKAGSTKYAMRNEAKMHMHFKVAKLLM